jgi:hypothetical protein
MIKINAYQCFIACNYYLEHEAPNINKKEDIWCYFEISEMINGLYYKQTNRSCWREWMRCIFKAIEKTNNPTAAKTKEVTISNLITNVFNNIVFKYNNINELKNSLENDLYCSVNTVSPVQGFMCIQIFINKFYQETDSYKSIFSILKAQKNKPIKQFETTKTWQSWLECFKESQTINTFPPKKLKTLSASQCFWTHYEYIKYDDYRYEEDGTLYWEDWIEIVNNVISKENVDFALNNEGVTLEQGLEAVRMFVDKYYDQQDKNILLINAAKDLDEVLKDKHTIKDSHAWTVWLDCFEEAKKLDSY